MHTQAHGLQPLIQGAVSPLVMLRKTPFGFHRLDPVFDRRKDVGASTTKLALKALTTIIVNDFSVRGPTYARIVLPFSITCSCPLRVADLRRLLIVRQPVTGRRRRGRHEKNYD
jgi:hypothetical protein